MNKKIYIFIAIAVVVLGGWWYFSAKSYQQFSVDTSTATVAGETQIVKLKNGETYNLTASIVKKVIAGSEVKMLAYNGMIPGPTIKVSKGAEISINFTNNTDVPTTIHSHGVRLSNKFDGVPDMTQKE